MASLRHKPADPGTGIDSSTESNQPSQDGETASAAVLDISLEPAELHPELADSIYDSPGLGPMVHHPLLIHPFYAPPLNNYLNQMLEQKKGMLAKATEDGNHRLYVFLHERPYRWEAFDRIQDKLDNETYWELAADTYIDSENNNAFREIVRDCLTSERGSRSSIMLENELEAFAKLPERITLYKDLRDCDNFDDDFSFTINPDVAWWFACRFDKAVPGEPIVQVFECNKADAIALFLRRGEDEILIDPDLVEFKGNRTKRPKKTKRPGEDQPCHVMPSLWKD